MALNPEYTQESTYTKLENVMRWTNDKIHHERVINIRTRHICMKGDYFVGAVCDAYSEKCLYLLASLTAAQWWSTHWYLGLSEESTDDWWSSTFRHRRSNLYSWSSSSPSTITKCDSDCQASKFIERQAKTAFIASLCERKSREPSMNAC